jgi:hypothetical protein
MRSLEDVVVEVIGVAFVSGPGVCGDSRRAAVT